jgi:hypothetical protein
MSRIVGLATKHIPPKTKKRLKDFILDNMNVDRLVATYDKWIVENFPDAIELVKQREESKEFEYRPLISVTVPTYNTPDKFLRECIESVIAQSYDNWELILVDDASPDVSVREIIEEYASKDKRIRYKFLAENQHIAGATNEAIKLATGEFIGLFDHDDLLWPNALYEVAKALNVDKKIEFIYTDEDKIIEEKSRHAEPFFKPDWSPALLRTCNYITHFSVFKRELLEKVGYEDGKYNGAQDWEMIMRGTRGTRYIHHISKVVYSWRVHDNSTAKTMDSKPYVIGSQRSTIVDDLIARGFKPTQFQVKQDARFGAFWKTTFKNIGRPRVSIIVLDSRQARSIKRKTKYGNYELIIADNYNDGLEKSTGSFIVFVEEGMRIKSRNWIRILLNSSKDDTVGVIGGPTLYTNNGYIYSAGVAMNDDGYLTHALSNGVTVKSLRTLTRNIYVHTRRNVTALTGCVAIKRSTLGDFKFDVSRNTTEQLIILAAEQIEKGLFNVYDPDFVTVIDQKYIPRPSIKKASHKEIYTDVSTKVRLGKKYKKARTQCYFRDDLVSLPYFNS